MLEKTPEEIIKEHYQKIGRKGGKAKSEKKTKACRENIKKRWEKHKKNKGGIRDFLE